MPSLLTFSFVRLPLLVSYSLHTAASDTLQQMVEKPATEIANEAMVESNNGAAAKSGDCVVVSRRKRAVQVRFNDNDINVILTMNRGDWKVICETISTCSVGETRVVPDRSIDGGASRSTFAVHRYLSIEKL